MKDRPDGPVGKTLLSHTEWPQKKRQWLMNDCAHLEPLVEIGGTRSPDTDLRGV